MEDIRHDYGFSGSVFLDMIVNLLGSSWKYLSLKDNEFTITHIKYIDLVDSLYTLRNNHWRLSNVQNIDNGITFQLVNVNNSYIDRESPFAISRLLSNSTSSSI